MLYYQHAHVLTIWVDPVVMQIPGSPLLVDIRLCISCRHLFHYTHSTPSLKKTNCSKTPGILHQCHMNRQWSPISSATRWLSHFCSMSWHFRFDVFEGHCPRIYIHVRVYRGMLLIFLYDLYVSWWTIFTAGSRSELPSMCWLSDAKAPTSQFPECESITPMWAHSNISWQIPGLF